jgi:acylphosphatase
VLVVDVDRIQFRVAGRVQGVGFRHFVLSRARSLGLRGWVRNEGDGSVLVLAEGDRRSIDALRESVGHGPRSARVDSVVDEPVIYSGVLPDFEVRYSGW